MAVNEGKILEALNLGAKADKLFSNTPEDPILKATQIFLQAAIDEMKRILKDEGRTTGTNSLYQSIVTTEPKQDNEGVFFGIEANDYAEYVDKGVNAAPGKHKAPPGRTPTTNALKNEDGKQYAFKNLKVSPSFLDAVRDWITNKPTGLQNSIDVLVGVAINIKKRGIEPANFIGRAIGPEALAIYEKAIGEIIDESLDIQFKLYPSKDLK